MSAEFDVGAVGSTVPRDADGGRGRRSCLPDMELSAAGSTATSKDRPWSPLKMDCPSGKSDRRVRLDRSDRRVGRGPIVEVEDDLHQRARTMIVMHQSTDPMK